MVKETMKEISTVSILDDEDDSNDNSDDNSDDDDDGFW